MTIDEEIQLAGSMILVVDNVPANRQILTQTLESAGYTVAAAPNGDIALKVASRNTPDLILLDLMMPGMNGFEVCERLKQAEATSSVPVIFITANNEMENVVKGFEIGAVDYITKPFKTEEVLVRAQTHLKINRLTRALITKNLELLQLNTRLLAEMSARSQTEDNLSQVVEGRQEPFHISGTLRHDAPSYVERPADREILEALTAGEICYVLTARQMGKSSLMVRAANRLRERNIHVATLDLTAIGQNLTSEQWYDGMLSRLGRRLNLENELDDYWLNHERLGPVQRFFEAIHKVALPKRPGNLVILIDELDVVRSLPFSTDEFFGAIRECYNERTEDPTWNRLTFCLLGVATPSQLVDDPSITLFNIGRMVALSDFTLEEIRPFAAGLVAAGLLNPSAESMLTRVFHWTSGHPYLTQCLCRAIVDRLCNESSQISDPAKLVDELCSDLFLTPRALERDDNLIFVRERLFHSGMDFTTLISVYRKVLTCEDSPINREDQEAVKQLNLSGLTRLENGVVKARNRIYQYVFDLSWVESQCARSTAAD